MELTKLWSISFLQSFLIILQIFLLDFSISTDTITSTQFIKDPQFIISKESTFKFGFFSPPNTTNRYVGVLYNIPTITPIWVANRKNHLNDSKGSFVISEEGNLVILDGQNRSIWLSNLSNTSNSTTIAQILDTGNLILRDNSSGNTLWESFKNPCDSFLQNMEISEVNRLTSWKSPFDPSIGTFSASVDASNIPQVMIWKNSQPYWRSGPWNGHIFIGIPKMDSVYLDGFSLDIKKGTLNFVFANASLIRYFRLNSNGTLVNRYWYEGQEDWGIISEIPEDECDIYGKCGPFGTCQFRKGRLFCSCLKGFKPKNLNEWDTKIFTSGCERKVPLKCDRNGGIEEGKEDIFVELSTMKVPDLAQYSSGNEDDCKNLCLSKCSCVAYSYYTGTGCMHWNSTLIDIKRFSDGKGADLYIRVAYSERDKKRNMEVLIIVMVVIGSIIFAISVYLFWKWINKRKVTKQESEVFPERGGFYQDYSSESTPRRVKVEELPLFTFNDIAIATENFHSANKLGQGGFGPVYKGKLSHGKEIAVKRLSESSGQGLEEFMNEVVVISKLQHRNLVRLLGCCVEKDEKILVYEYMPNRSLDALLFDKLNEEHLDWPKRVNIIEGICRGLLYLHRDSRLKIIHRDLKPSNILLDTELNPKISDFGTARIFGGNQNQANTIRVVGTYGYMSPEYVMEGRFSEKSDVFSFGVLLLEIVSGKRNASFYHDEFTLSLIGYAWKLWKEEKVLEFIDPKISNPSFRTEILRYIHVGLSCVQEFADDRPNISIVLSMLSKEIDNLPTLKRPAFTKKQPVLMKEIPQQIQEKNSSNNISISLVVGR